MQSFLRWSYTLYTTLFLWHLFYGRCTLMQMEQATLERMFNNLMPKHESDCIIHFSNT